MSARKESRNLENAARQAFLRAGFNRKEANEMVAGCKGAFRQVLRTIAPVMQQYAPQPVPVYARAPR